MFRFDDWQFFCVGAAAAIDTALLFALVERRNRRRVLLPLILLVAGMWLTHLSTFVHAQLAETTAGWAPMLHWMSMMGMACGLLIMPSAMLHAFIRLRRCGVAVGIPPNPLYALIYLPMLALAPAAAWLASDPAGAFLDILAPLVVPYVTWLCVVNLVVALGFLRLRRHLDLPCTRAFLASTAALLVALALLHAFVFFLALRVWPNWESYLVTTAVLSPVILALLFAYFVLRFNFMQIILERTIVYGVIAVGVMLFHRIVLRDLWRELGERYQVDFAMFVGLLVVVLILLYRPLRQRTAEALRYLMGERVSEVRARTRRFSVEMSALSGQPPPEVLAWFTESVCSALDISHVEGWLFGPASHIAARGGDRARLEDDRAVALYRELTARRMLACTRRDAPGPSVERAFEQADAELAVVLDHPPVAGLLLFGRRTRNREMTDEQTGAIVMLVEQLGITLSNSLLQADRLAAERRAQQHEKLSTLGLVASSIAHEVKNPLSSIKTIATVLAEELGPNDKHAEELRLIVGEIDRLSDTVTQLLRFARPGAPGPAATDLADVLADTLRIMRHVARQRKVTIATDMPPDLPTVRAEHGAVREVLFNLLSNSIDAAGDGGRVTVACRAHNGHVVVEVGDTGPGIAPEFQDRLFEPFVTTKQDGTGLGLYVVGRRVRELGGEIHCETAPGEGTTFTVRLPYGAR